MDRIWAAPMPQMFHAPNVDKYNGEIDPKIWLVNYRLTMKATAALNPNFMIPYYRCSLWIRPEPGENIYGRAPSTIGLTLSVSSTTTLRDPTPNLAQLAYQLGGLTKQGLPRALRFNN